MKLIFGDCLEKMKDMPDQSVDLVVTSPPYDNLRTYNGIQWNFDIFGKIAIELTRCLRMGGVIVWIVNDATINGSETGTSFRQALYFKDVCKLNLHDTMLYLKKAISHPDTNRYYSAFEYMFIFSKGKPKSFNPIKDRKNICFGQTVHGTKRNFDDLIRKQSCIGNLIKEYGVRFNYWLISNQKRGIENQHPAVFPLTLVTDHIISWSNESDTVFDPFMGSGTTGIACFNTNRNFIGIEKDMIYFELAKRRINDYVNN